MSFLTGTAPKSTFSTQPTVLPEQQDLLKLLTSLLTGSTGTAATQVGANSLSALEAQSLALPTTATSQQTTATDQSFNALTGAFDYKAPTVKGTTVSPTAVTGSTVSSTPIDATAAFQKGVVDPLTTKFLERTLPAIAGQFGGSAGGAYGSGSLAARTNAATDLETTLADTGSQYSLAAGEFNSAEALKAALANQATGLTAGLANQKTGLTTDISNQATTLAADTSNQTAGINAQKLLLEALGLAPTTATLPEKIAGSDISLSKSTLDPYQKLIADLIAGGTGTTQQTIGVGSGGSTGLLGGLLSGVSNFAGSSAGSDLLASWLSDRRAKEDIEEIGQVDGFPLYKFKYKGVPGRHIGMMAQDVEKRLPEAVGQAGPYKTVNYAAVIESVLKEAA